jgi:DNA-binding transcriptional MerR regulator
MIEKMLTVSQVAKQVGAAPNTIRGYCRDFGQFLSEGATPKAGQERKFTEDDIPVLVSIKTLKAQRTEKDAIIASLLQGERYEPAEVSEEPKEEPESAEKPATKELAPKDLLDRFVMPLLDSIQTQLDDEREARVRAEREAAEYKAKWETTFRRHWYQFWIPDKPEEG